MNDTMQQYINKPMYVHKQVLFYLDLLSTLITALWARSRRCGASTEKAQGLNKQQARLNENYSGPQVSFQPVSLTGVRLTKL